MTTRTKLLLGLGALIAIAFGLYLFGPAGGLAALLGVGGTALARARAEGARAQAETQAAAVERQATEIGSAVERIDAATEAEVDRIEARTDARRAAPTTEDERRLMERFGPKP